MFANADYLRLRRAIISTYDKAGLLPLCELLKQADVEIISTGNTARYLREHGLAVVDVESVTQFPEILDGRVKTLHPRIFAGLLARRDFASHVETLEAHRIDPIDLVVVNLYPFETKPEIETIDVGGPSLLRAAAKNYEHVVVLSDPSQYSHFISQFAKSHGTKLEDRKSWAAAAFSRTARYDQAIANWFSNKELRYGENPHQRARVITSDADVIGLASVVPLQGKELSYNNFLDAHAAILSLRCLMTGAAPSDFGSVIIKHTTPCGAALALDLVDATKRAFASDPTSAFGGVVALSSQVNEATALLLKGHFLEIVIAPAFTPQAREIIAQKKDLRLLELPQMLAAPWPRESMRSIFGGTLVQNFDTPEISADSWTVASQRQPSAGEHKDLTIANHLALPCLSNAITIVKNAQLIGVGAGQTSRIDSVKLAISKAREYGHSLDGAVMASDGFFPFADSLHAAKEAGITAIIQPGGSKKDSEVIAAADTLGLAMIFTQTRHFRH